MTSKSNRRRLLKLPCPPLFCCSRLWSLSYVSAADHKVNGRELPKVNQEDAVEAFRSTKDPIVVEIFRKSATTINPFSCKSPTMDVESSSPSSFVYCDSCTQTEWTGGWGDVSPIGLFPFGQTDLMQSPSVMFPGDEEHHYETLDDVLGQDDEEDVACELEYEEVTLCRSHSQEKLGLTLCYASPDEPETNIFVREVEPESLAAKDGRIMEGDQLLQVNGIDVNNREQAVSLFANKDPKVTLLLSRPKMQADDDDDEEDRFQVEDYSREFYMFRQHREVSSTETPEVSFTNEKEKASSTAPSFSREWSFFLPHSTSSSTQDMQIHSSQKTKEGCADKCSNTNSTTPGATQENLFVKRNLLDTGQESQQDGNALSRIQSDTSLDKEMAALNKEMQNIQIECESLVSRHIREQWFRCRAGHQYVTFGDLRTTTMEHVGSMSFATAVNSDYHESSDGATSRQLNDMSAVIPPPEAFSTKHRKENVAQWIKGITSESKAGSVITKPKGVSEVPLRCTPLTLELSPVPSCSNGKIKEFHDSYSNPPVLVDKSTQLCESDVASVVSCDTCRYCQVLVHQKSISRGSDQISRQHHFVDYDQHQQQVPAYSVSRTINRTNDDDPYQMGNEKLHPKPSNGDFVDRQMERNKNYVTFYPCATMYTNQENLQHTIWLQQQLFRQALAQKHFKKASTIPTCAPLNPKQLAQKYPSPSLDTLPPMKNLAHPPLLPAPTLLSTQPQEGAASKSSVVTPTEEPNDEAKMEWKVKRRPDGTRYITRRPVRNKILKEREQQIMEERCGITTDDDAASELKVGRYWTKEERKRHLEKSRDRKQKREMMLKTAKVPETAVDRTVDDDDSSQGKRDSFATSFLNPKKKPPCCSVGRRRLRIPSTPSSTVLDDPSAFGLGATFGILSVTTV